MRAALALAAGAMFTAAMVLRDDDRVPGYSGVLLRFSMQCAKFAGVSIAPEVLEAMEAIR